MYTESGLGGREGRASNRPVHISNIMATLRGLSLSPAPAMLPSSSLSPGQSPWRAKATWRAAPSQRSWSQRDSWAPLQSLRLFGKKGCSVHGSQAGHITFFVGLFALFPQIDMSLLSIPVYCWLTKKLRLQFIWLDRWAEGQSRKKRHVWSYSSNKVCVFFVISYKLIKSFITGPCAALWSCCNRTH